MKFDNYGKLAGIGAAAWVGLQSLVVQAAPWDAKFFNPMPSKDDVILPMPCDGSMVFRKIDVPAAGPLDDYPIQIGQEGSDFGYVENVKPVHIAGSFTEPKSKSRYYLLAKYEMTDLQYKALMEPSCPKPGNMGRLPVVGISWLQAMSAADAYNRWLRQNAAAKLPKEDGALGFMRLPTEVEWEFAARGGMKVQQAEYKDIRYPMPDGLNAHEWFAGAQSANGKLQLSGLLKPNPLGLHDMLGNVDEMVFEPFRLNKLDRDHGQAGGFVVRGGNYLLGQAEIRSAQRKENDYYDAQGAKTSKTTGFRLALVSTALTSRERINNIEKSWKNLGAGTADAGKKTTVQELNALSAKVEDKKLKEQLKNLENQLRASNQKQEEARDQAIRSSLNLGAFLCTKLLDDGKFLENLQRNYEMTCKGEGALSAESCNMRKQKLAEQENRVSKLGVYYASHLVESSGLYGENLLEKQVPVLQDFLSKNAQLKELEPYLKTHWANSKMYFKNKKVDATAWLKSCKELK